MSSLSDTDSRQPGGPGGDAGPPDEHPASSTSGSREPKGITPQTQVFIGLLFAYLGLGMVVPVMAPLVRQLGLTELQGGLIFAVNYLMWVLASPLWGSGTEVWGRKPVILIGLFGFSLGHLFFGIAADIGLHGWLGGTALLSLLIVTRAFAGALFSGAPPAAQAYVVDSVSARNRTTAVGLLGAAAGLGTVMGPVVTVVTSFIQVPLTVPLYGAAALPVIPAIILWVSLPKGQARKREKPPRLVMWDRRYSTVLAVGLVMNVAFALVLFTLGFYIQDRLMLDEHDTTLKSAVAMFLVGVVAVFVQVVLLRVLRWSPVTLMRVGLSIMAVGMAFLVATFGNEYLIYTAVVIIGLGYAFTYPGFQSAITFTVTEGEQGAVAGLAAGAGAIAFIIGPVVGTWLYGWHWESPYIISAVLLVFTAIVAMVHPRLKTLRRVSKGIEPHP